MFHLKNVLANAGRSAPEHMQEILSFIELSDQAVAHSFTSGEVVKKPRLLNEFQYRLAEAVKTQDFI